VAQNEVEQNEVAQNEVAQNEVAQNEVAQNEVARRSEDLVAGGVKNRFFRKSRVFKPLNKYKLFSHQLI
jgi:hypothetical protein